MVAQIDKRFTRLSYKKTYTRYLSYILYEGRPLTTSGRWINPLVFSLYWLQTYLPFAKKVKKPIFILGTGRSGTTILGITLGVHNDVGFLNEPKAFWSYLNHKDDLIGSYLNELGHYRLTNEDSSSLIAKKAHQIYGNYLKFGFSSRVVDKYPELIFRTGYVTSIFPDARYLFLYRNGYDTCHSIQLWSERLGVEKSGENHDWWGKNDRKWKLLCDQIVSSDDVLYKYIDLISKYTNHVDRAAVEWIVTMKEGISLLALNPNNIMGVKYEEYTSSFEKRNEILRFCDLPLDNNFDSFCEAVLKAPKPKAKINLPNEIEHEFLRIMGLLGYE